MDLSLFKILGTLVSPAKWLYGLCVDQTRINISVPSVKDWPCVLFPVEDKGGGTGLLLFGVTTRSKKPVEITRVEVDYAASLQLLDPGNRGFFVGSGTLDMELPFRMFWKGSAVVRSDLQQGFALAVKFLGSIHEQRVRISIYARRQVTSVGGFVAEGRQRVTTKEYRVRLTTGPVLGLAVPPKCAFTTPQPFLTESAANISGGPGPVMLHECMSNGTVSSKRVDLPGA